MRKSFPSHLILLHTYTHRFINIVRASMKCYSRLPTQTPLSLYLSLSLSLSLLATVYVKFICVVVVITFSLSTFVACVSCGFSKRPKSLHLTFFGLLCFFYFFFFAFFFYFSSRKFNLLPFYFGKYLFCCCCVFEQCIGLMTLPFVGFLSGSLSEIY